ncbi:MAG: ABC transporter ATP-binding protein [Flavobacteriales bacterium]
MIEVENLSKRYKLGSHKSDTLRGLLSSWRFSQEKESFLALDNVSFSVSQGETVGVIGRNGAGKSTLMKIISKITKPTSGQVKIYGRVSSLLEVGTGFHPELTGRENIFLNGSILGMTRAEIKNRFDEIVDFSGISEFLDTPVKHYSSGMYVRLAFAVAAHLEPEVLIVDEVLAVGDVDFQRKCFDKMQDVGKSGRTVLLVSHNMEAIERICERTIVLDHGKNVFTGDVAQGISVYSGVNSGNQSSRRWNTNDAPGNDKVRLVEISCRDSNGVSQNQFDCRYPIRIRFEFEVKAEGFQVHPAFHVMNERGICEFISGDFHHPEWGGRKLKTGTHKMECIIPGNLLSEGKHSLMVMLSSKPVSSAPYINHVNIDNCIVLNVFDLVEGDSARGLHKGPYPGVLRPKLKWNVLS